MTFPYSLVLVLVLLGGCARAGAGPERAVDAEGRVTEGQLSPRTLLTGEVVAEDALPLVAPNVGIWPLQVRWLVEDGTVVQQGDAVVELDTSQLAANLESLRNQVTQRSSTSTAAGARADSEVAAARLAVETAEARVAKARLEADLPLDIFAAREADRRRAELAKAELELEASNARLTAATTTGRADVELAEAELVAARGRVGRLEDDLERLTLRADRSGIVVLTESPWEGRPPRIGDTAWPGQTLATLPNLATLVIEARLFDVDEGAVVPGQTALIVLDAFPQRTFRAHVRSVDQTAREVGRSPLRRAFRVVLSLDEGDPEVLRPGMSARVELDVPAADGSRLVPRTAVRWATEGPRLVLLSGREMEVKLGPCDAHQCVLLEGPDPGTRLGKAG